MLARMWKKRKLLCVAGGNVNWYTHHEEQSGGSSKAKNKTMTCFVTATPL